MYAIRSYYELHRADGHAFNRNLLGSVKAFPLEHNDILRMGKAMLDKQIAHPPVHGYFV